MRIRRSHILAPLHNYNTTERELLAIVETLKEFRTILLGQKLKIFTDHKNLTFTKFNTERIMRWRMVLFEYHAELIYLKGKHNIVSNALSRLDLIPDNGEILATQQNELPADIYPLKMSCQFKGFERKSRLYP